MAAAAWPVRPTVNPITGVTVLPAWVAPASGVVLTVPGWQALVMAVLVPTVVLAVPATGQVEAGRAMVVPVARVMAVLAVQVMVVPAVPVLMEDQAALVAQEAVAAQAMVAPTVVPTARVEVLTKQT